MKPFLETDLGDFVQKFPARAGLRILLSGDLGSGKTTFARYWLANERVTPEFQGSPTFAYQFTYRHPSGLIVMHLDLYRVNRPSEVETLGLAEVLSDPHSVALVEWPERLGDQWRWDSGLEVKNLHFELNEAGGHLIGVAKRP